MKQCRKCSVDLVVGKNIPPSLFNNFDYICRPCKSGYDKSYSTANAEIKKVKAKIYRGKPDVKKRNQKYMKVYRPNNKDKWDKSVFKIQNKIPAGIYEIYDGDKLIYIGESNKPYRRKCEHFTIHGIRGGKPTTYLSSVNKALNEGELQRDKLRFKMLKYIDDMKERKAEENRLIQRYKPLYN